MRYERSAVLAVIVERLQRICNGGWRTISKSWQEGRQRSVYGRERKI